MKKYFIMIIALFLIITSVGCHRNNDYDGQVKVTFSLEGGTYMNCTNNVVLYFNFKNDEANKICSPTSLTGNDVEKSGYELVGWFKTKTDDNGSISYSDEFDFERDKVSGSELVLYAQWKKIIKYSYNVCWYQNNEMKILGSYPVNAGEKFEDYSNYYKKNFGYTALGYFDESGLPWDWDFVHPGGDENLAINVIVKYIEGTYTIVDSSDDLGTLIKTSQNIYLTNDIDMNGSSLCFDNYRGTIKGNGHKISNFTLNYGASKNDLVDDFTDIGKKSLCLSLFGMTNGASINDVTFENVTFSLKTGLSTTHKIYVVPLAVKMEKTNISNVNFTGNVNIVELPDGFNVEENLVIVTDSGYYLKDDESNVENVNINFEIEE